MTVIAGRDRRQVMPVRSRKRPSLLAAVLRRLLWIPGLLASLRADRSSKVEHDLELELYAGMFPRGFLHYGYFPQVGIPAEQISFRDLEDAQLAYAQKLINLVEDRARPVLDVGCGMGGISYLLREKGFEVYPLTPDGHQAAYISDKEPGLQVIQSTFEAFEAGNSYPGKYGTILTSESLQYLDLETSLPKIRQLLAPGGIWIASDYFRFSAQDKTSGHVWREFQDQLKKHGFAIRLQEDITDHILPTLEFASFLANRFILPANRYLQAKFHHKKPVAHYLLKDVVGHIDRRIEESLQTVDPAIFRQRKQYLLLVIEPV